MQLTKLPPFLYHGTRLDHWPQIQEKGLQPRSHSGVSQWTHTIESRDDAVYLTTAYPLHFAMAAKSSKDVLILEIDTEKLDPQLFMADEDALAHGLQHPDTTGMDLAERTRYFRKHSHLYEALPSLGLLGNCAYRGSIPFEAISRTCQITKADAVKLVIGGFDPCIIPLNFAIMGAEYQNSVSWMFGDQPTCPLNPRLTDIPRKVSVLPLGA